MQLKSNSATRSGIGLPRGDGRPAERLQIGGCGDASGARTGKQRRKVITRPVAYVAARSSRNSEAGLTPVTSRWSRARVQAT